MSCDKCHKLATKETNKYYCNSCGIYPEKVTPRYRVRLQISDHTSTTSCTLFDEEAARLLNTSASKLLDTLDGKSEEAPKIIQQLCGKRLIFRFNLNDSNLTFGTQNYAVKRTFMPNDKLEMLYLENKAEEELMDDEVDTVLMKKQNMPDRKSKNNKVSPGELSCERVPVKEEPNDSNGTT
ncbi:replication protein A 70 kDa DNA-binding subunit A [Triticum aestivum]|uniref:replication protein A 70 kDa DNA-binding subunit A n=1 Tax=Triticum aestivum TaxID=4565 RepID=UPI001D01C95B|nr:replication protein A 70 kDa DNA-binding subunit A-like [Triticum aestivum]